MCPFRNLKSFSLDLITVLIHLLFGAETVRYYLLKSIRQDLIASCRIDLEGA